MSDLSPILEDSSVLESPKIVHALEAFIVEAIEEATDLLRCGDMTTRTALIKTVLSMALKSKDNSTAVDAEKIYAKARETIAGLLDPE